METLIVQVSKVLYTSGKGWMVLKTDKGTAVGTAGFAVAVGDRIKVQGEWKRSDYNGQMQFQFKGAVLDIPENRRALLSYVASITDGIGPAMEERIYEAYGDDWKAHPDLDGIAGVSCKTAFAWKDSLARLDSQEAQAQAIAWLMEKGATLNMAQAAWEKWGGGTIGTVTANPYALCELPRYGFAHVDKLHAAFGIADDDPRRFDACVMYFVGQIQVKTGDTAVDLGDVYESVFRLFPCTVTLWAAALERLAAAGVLSVVEESGGPGFAILTGDAKREREIAERFGVTKEDHE